MGSAARSGGAWLSSYGFFSSLFSFVTLALFLEYLFLFFSFFFPFPFSSRWVVEARGLIYLGIYMDDYTPLGTCLHLVFSE